MIHSCRIALLFVRMPPPFLVIGMTGGLGGAWWFAHCCDGLVNQTLSAVKLSATVRRTWKSLKSCNLQHIIVQKAKETICSSRRWERRGFFYIAMTLSDSFAESDMGVAWCCLYDAKTFALHFRTCSWYLAVPCLSDWGGTFTSHKSISLDRRRSGSIACAQSVEMPEALEAQISHQLMSKGKIWEADDYIPVSKAYQKTVQKPLRCGRFCQSPLSQRRFQKKGSQLIVDVFGGRGAREDSSADLKIHRGKGISVKPSHWAVKPMKKRKRSCGSWLVVA